MVQILKNASESSLWSSEGVPVTVGGRVGCAGGRPAEGGPPALGLSLVHICSQAQDQYDEAGGVDDLTEIDWAEGGNCTRVRRKGGGGWNGPRSKRGAITGFSRHARVNCISAFNTVDRSKVVASWFASLTVPAGECDWLQMERHRRAYCDRLRRAWGTNVCGFWRKEPHASGYPHLHLLLLWLGKPPKMKHFRKWNDRAWAEVVKSPNPHHEARGCRVEEMRRWEGAAWYLAKYLSKTAEFAGSEKVGRQWGYHNREVMPVRIEAAKVPAEVGRRVQRILRQLQQRKREKFFAWLPPYGCQSGHRWERLRGAVIKSMSGRVRGYQTVEEQVAMFRRSGDKVRRWRPKCAVTLNVPVWREVFDGNGRHVCYERGEDEKITRLAGLYLVPAEVVKRLVDHYTREFQRAAPF